MIRRHFNMVATIAVVLALLGRMAAPVFAAPAVEAHPLAGLLGPVCTASHAAGGGDRSQGAPQRGDGEPCHHCVLCQIARPAPAVARVPVAFADPRVSAPAVFAVPAAVAAAPALLRLASRPRAPPALPS